MTILPAIAVAGAVAVAALSAPAPATSAAPSRQAAAACNAVEPVLSRRTHLRSLLEELAARRGFKLVYWAADDPEVAHGGGSDIALMTSLSEQANLIVRYAPRGPRCPGHWKIDTVWVLPAGIPASPGAPRAAPTAPAEPDTAMVEYLQAHGMARPVAPAASQPSP